VKVGDLVRFVDVFGNDERVALILVVDVDMAKTTFGWVNKTLLKVINESR
jgi:hypothetical protein